MSTRGFFSVALVLPLLGGLLGLLLPGLRVFSVALLFGGVPYVVVAVALTVLIRGAATKRRLVRLSLMSPICFAALVVAFVGIVGSTSATRELPLSEDARQLLPIGIYAVVFAYFYIACAWALWFVGRKVGVVRDEFAAS